MNMHPIISQHLNDQEVQYNFAGSYSIGIFWKVGELDQVWLPLSKDHLSATALISISYKIAHYFDYTTTDFLMIGEMDLLNPFLARGSNLTTAGS